MHEVFWWEREEERDRQGHLDVGERMLFKLVQKNKKG